VIDIRLMDRRLEDPVLACYLREWSLRRPLLVWIGPIALRRPRMARTRLRVDGGSASSVLSGVRLGWDAAMGAVYAQDFHMAVMAPAELRASKPGGRAHGVVN